MPGQLQRRAACIKFFINGFYLHLPVFCLTLAASYLLQTRQAEENARYMLSSNLEDGAKYLRMVITNATHIRECLMRAR